MNCTPANLKDIFGENFSAISKIRGISVDFNNPSPLGRGEYQLLRIIISLEKLDDTHVFLKELFSFVSSVMVYAGSWIGYWEKYWQVIHGYYRTFASYVNGNSAQPGLPSALVDCDPWFKFFECFARILAQFIDEFAGHQTTVNIQEVIDNLVSFAKYLLDVVDGIRNPEPASNDDILNSLSFFTGATNRECHRKTALLFEVPSEPKLVNKNAITAHNVRERHGTGKVVHHANELNRLPVYLKPLSRLDDSPVAVPEPLPAIDAQPAKPLSWEEFKKTDPDCIAMEEGISWDEICDGDWGDLLEDKQEAPLPVTPSKPAALPVPVVTETKEELQELAKLLTAEMTVTIGITISASSTAEEKMQAGIKIQEISAKITETNRKIRALVPVEICETPFHPKKPNQNSKNRKNPRTHPSNTPLVDQASSQSTSPDKPKRNKSGSKNFKPRNGSPKNSPAGPQAGTNPGSNKSNQPPVKATQQTPNQKGGNRRNRGSKKSTE